MGIMLSKQHLTLVQHLNEFFLKFPLIWHQHQFIGFHCLDFPQTTHQQCFLQAQLPITHYRKYFNIYSSSLIKPIFKEQSFDLLQRNYWRISF